MDMELVKERAEYYQSKEIWKHEEMQESEKFRQSLKFESESDLDFGVMDYYYGGMLSMIIGDAGERTRRDGLNAGYGWGKRYLSSYAGCGCMVSKSEQPALHTQAAYDVVTCRLAEECLGADGE